MMRKHILLTVVMMILLASFATAISIASNELKPTVNIPIRSLDTAPIIKTPVVVSSTPIIKTVSPVSPPSIPVKVAIRSVDTAPVISPVSKPSPVQNAIRESRIKTSIRPATIPSLPRLLDPIFPLGGSARDCVAPPDTDTIDNPPSIAWSEYEPAPALVRENFIIRVCVVDDMGVDRIRVRLGEYNEELRCTGQRSCVKEFTTSQAVAGVYNYRVYGYDTATNFYLDVLPVTVRPDCADTDMDLRCDSDEAPSCIGQNLANIPSNSTCQTYAFENGCHVPRVDDGRTICSMTTSYVCSEGSTLGRDVFQQSFRQYCGGGTGMCDGSVETVGDASVADNCMSDEYCMEGNPVCVSSGNSPPVMDNIGDQMVGMAEPLLIDVNANDPDGDTLRYSTDAPFGSIDATSGIYRYIGDERDRGTHVVTFTVTDGSLSDRETIQIIVGGSSGGPSIAGVAVTPDPAFTNDMLTCTPSGWSSAEPPMYQYRWMVDGSLMAGQTASTFDCSAMAGCHRGSMITCQVTPVDSSGVGTPRIDSVTIQNSPPVMSTVTVNPMPPTAMADVTCACGAISDPDGDSAFCNYFEIFRNGMLYASGPTATLRAADATSGVMVMCKARAFDGEMQSELMSSGTVTIGNAPPTVTSVTGWGWTDNTAPFGLSASLGEESLITAMTTDPDGPGPVTLTCTGEASSELSECRYNFATKISGLKPAECDSHPESGCYGIMDNQGPLMVNLNANDGTSTSITPVGVTVSLRYLPPVITASNIVVTEGDPVFCPCTPMDPDGGSASVTCAAPISGTGPWLPRYANIGVISSHCIATDNEGQKSRKDFTITVNEGVYDVRLRSRAENPSGMLFDETKMITAPTTRSLLNDNDLWEYTDGNPGCTATLCVNIGTLTTIADYFNNFRTRISESDRVYIYGTSWPMLTDNNGNIDTNGEVTTVSFNVTKI